MKGLIFASLILCSSLSFGAGLTPDEAYEIIKINETFPAKKILMTPSLCTYQNELIEQAKPKYKHLEKLNCPRNEGSTTKDQDLSAQLQQIKELETLTANEDSLDSESNDLLDKMIINMPVRRK